MLLVILITSYLLSAFLNAQWIADMQLALFSVTGLLALRNAPLRRRTVRIVVSAALIVSLLMSVVAVHHEGDTGRGAAAVWTGILLLLTVILLVRQILLASSVTMQSIFGAISVYLIIGLMFAAFYGAMFFLNSRHFFADGRAGTTSTFQYFSFTTLTTLGYGDYTAAYSAGRAVAMIEAMTGQIFLATLVAKLVASFRPAGRPADDTADAPAAGSGAAAGQPGLRPDAGA